MSLWSWIGLVDKKEFMNLQLEIKSLREEARSLQEQNHQLIQSLEEHNARKLGVIEQEMSLNREEAEKHSLQVEEQFESLNSNVIAIEAIIKDSNKQIQVNCENSSRISDKLQNIIECYNVKSKNNHKEVMQELDLLSRHLDKKTNNIDDIQEKLCSISESTMSLWSTMKAIWVNAILEDIDHATK